MSTETITEDKVDYEIDAETSAAFKLQPAGTCFKAFLTTYERRDKVCVRPHKDTATFQNFLNGIGHQTRTGSWLYDR